MNLSILQGRLSLPDMGYQETPSDWRSEFSLLKEANISFIEWVITKKQLFNNPLFNEDVSEYPISVLCADNVVDKRVFEKGFFFDNIFPLCEMCQEYNISTIGIPLLEDSAVDTKEKKNKIISNLIDCCDAFPNLNINIEAELDFVTLLEIINSHKNLKITYDTGNMTAMNFKHDLYIDKVFDKITNVHLKDRNFNYGKSRNFGDGDTNFDLIFKTLSSLGYDGIFTLQMARGEPGDELNHIKKIVKIFRRLHEKYF